MTVGAKVRAKPEAPVGAAPDDAFFADLRAREFARLDREGLAYLDYTGAGLAAESQLDAHDALLRGPLLGNPHSEHAPSRAATAAVAEARAATLRLLDADPAEYAVCFAPNASGAAKIVAESFPFAPGGVLALSADNHNSVTGAREFARRAGAGVVTLPLTSELRLDDPAPRLAAARGRGDALFAFPAQSNFSGVRHPLALVDEARRLGYAVLLDAAAYVPTSPLSLRAVRPDFVILSYYKMFGFPTGVGALVARREALARLRRPWFAGGTVDWVSVQHGRHQLRRTEEAFEDGTPNFWAIAALAPGFAFLERVGMARLSARVTALTATLLEQLRGLTHGDGAPMVRLYGPPDARERGGTVACNFIDRTGRVIDYEMMEGRARDAGVAVRGGCFCNPGCSEVAFEFPPADSLRCLEQVSAAGFTPRAFADCMGDLAVGAVRLSVGVATTEDEVRRAVEVLGAIAGLT